MKKYAQPRTDFAGNGEAFVHSNPPTDRLHGSAPASSPVRHLIRMFAKLETAPSGVGRRLRAETHHAQEYKELEDEEDEAIPAVNTAVKADYEA